jgi:selenocysteine lyase/cysteine desulfurase
MSEHFRSFGVVNDNTTDEEIQKQSVHLPKTQESLEALRRNIVGHLKKVDGPFGPKPLCYQDWTASGRPLQTVESYVQQNILPLYGNTHTTTSITSHQSTCFRHEARQIIAQAINAKTTGRAAEDLVLFTGTGTTAAVNKLVIAMGLHVPLPAGYNEEDRPVVFTSFYEHHSNLLPWRESHCEVIAVNYDPINGVCLNHLKELLLKYHHRKLKIGAFSAASNVTGILTNVNAVSALMHRGGGIVIFDYATAAPYVKMNMNPIVIGDDAPFVYKDAIVFSGHKFIGGPGCPGVLIVKSKILPPQHEPPTFSGGGTVFYVSDDHHRYLSNRDEREEAGTPNIYGDIKLGLIIHLKQSLDPLWIEQEEFQIYHYVVRELSSISQLIVLGQQELTNNSIVTNRLPIFSIVIRCGARYLHHNFVCALLNDLFGIQARGGCQCAGPYSMYLLGINDVNNGLIEYSLLDKNEVS